jgi:hypothetical protein
MPITDASCGVRGARRGCSTCCARDRRHVLIETAPGPRLATFVLLKLADRDAGHSFAGDAIHHACKVYMPTLNWASASSGTWRAPRDRRLLEYCAEDHARCFRSTSARHTWRARARGDAFVNVRRWPGA